LIEEAALPKCPVLTYPYPSSGPFGFDQPHFRVRCWSRTEKLVPRIRLPEQFLPFTHSSLVSAHTCKHLPLLAQSPTLFHRRAHDRIQRPNSPLIPPPNRPRLRQDLVVNQNPRPLLQSRIAALNVWVALSSYWL